MKTQGEKLKLRSSGWEVQGGMFSVGCSRLDVQGWKFRGSGVGGSGLEIQVRKFINSILN